MKLKKVMAVVMTVAMTMGMMAGCGSKDASTEAEPVNETTVTQEAEAEAPEATASELAGVEISFLNSKGEIQEALEDIAVAFEDETGIKVEIQLCATGESPYTKVTSAYNSGSAPTMAMLDPTDVVSLAKEYAIDLSNEKWVAECGSSATTVDGVVYGFPFCIEGRGLIYNKKAIEDTLGKEFDPSSINSYDSLKALLEELRSAGMENPVVISKEDWSLGNHQLGFVYDTQDGTTDGAMNFIAQLKDGSASMGDNERFTQFLETFDLLCEYNINGADPLGALYEQDPIYLADGEAAFWANGCWAWANLAEAGASTDDEYGFISFVLGNDTSDFANTAIEAAATKVVMIDGVQASEEQVAAAKEFLNWLVYADNGQKMLVQNAGVIPAASNNTYEALDPLGQDIQARMKEGKTYSSSFIAPADHWSVLGASMQKYLGGQCSKDELAAEIDAYWTALAE